MYVPKYVPLDTNPPMQFLIDQYPQSLQFLSFPCECLGALLVCIEILRPNRADRIEDWVDDIPLHANWLRYRLYGKMPHMYVFLLLFAVVLFVFYVGTTEGLFYESVEAYVVKYDIMAGMLGFTLFGFVIAFPMCIVLDYRRFFSRTIAGLNRVSGGRAIGTIGMIIGLFGVAAEFLQMMGSEPIYVYAGVFILLLTIVGVVFGLAPPTEDELLPYSDEDLEEFDWGC